MKKIKSIHQLKAEKKRLQHKQDALEQQLRGQWQAIKAVLQPGNRKPAATNEEGDEKKSNGLLRQTLRYGFSLLAKKASEVTGNKLEQLLKKKKGSGQ